MAHLIWLLTVQEPGRTCPGRNTSCGQFGAAMAYDDAGEFKTKSRCLKAQKKYVRDFYRKTRKAGNTVAMPPETKCVKQRGE